MYRCRDKPDPQVSKTVSYILRHPGPDCGITLDEDQQMEVVDLLPVTAKICGSPISYFQLVELLKESNTKKKRYGA